MVIKAINDIASICYLKGLRNVVLSPGSRCAPLTLAFNRHGDFNIYTIPDERAAAFIALGMAERTETPTILICTSGTAVLNYAPAVTEAYYRNIPLLVITADRPPEWLEQWDGQTINQKAIFEPHIKKSFSFPDSFEHKDALWFSHRLVNEAINCSRSLGNGPVHINVPLREPFYPEKGEKLVFDKAIKLIDEPAFESSPGKDTLLRLSEELSQYAKIVIVVGQHKPDKSLIDALSIVSLKLNIPVVADIIANLHGFAGTIRHSDAFLPKAPASLKPDLLVTLGQSVISKNLKLFLRQHRASAHWHIAQAGDIPDPMQSLTRIVRMSPPNFFKYLVDSDIAPKSPEFIEGWRSFDEKVKENFNSIFANQPFNEFQAVYRFIKSTSGEAKLHLANSMAVRYANFVGLSSQQNNISVHANRGTSGIDGSSSTAVGITLTSAVPNYLITGDVSFFYDINAFWHNYLSANFKILLLNNHGGGIFRLIPGPSQQPELEELFETQQPRTAIRMAEEFGFSYFKSVGEQDFNSQLISFMDDENRAIFEVETDKTNNQLFFNHFKSYINT
ncbi:MAG: 2-succinyl-5-enolpyruvyl-6-hydroxy-3-cyclohexene-1-carboxylic-acid synthase [Imperialibacter sp.]